MPDADLWRSYTTFTQLGGRHVTVGEVTGELGRLPMDGVLGFLAMISLYAARADVDFFDPREHGDMLNWAIVDDFPCKLPDASKMCVPGHVPDTGDQQFFIHQWNVAWLAHFAVLNCDRGSTTPEFSFELRRRVCRLLLIVNDFFADPSEDPFSSLIDGKRFALSMMRLQQFSEFTEHAGDAGREVARQWKIFGEFLSVRYDAHRAFLEASTVELDAYFEFLIVFVTFVLGHMATHGGHRQSRQSIFGNFEEGQELALKILNDWAATPEKFETCLSELEQDYPLNPRALSHFDFVTLRRRPVIEDRPDQFVIPVLPYLVRKASDGPYFVMAEGNAEFREKYGKAYEDYANSLVTRIGDSPSGRSWAVFLNPPNRPDLEYCDAALVCGDTAIVFEHKGGIIPSMFLRGGTGDRVLGPDDEVLLAIDNGKIPTADGLKKSDDALLTHGLWQLASAAGSLVTWLDDQTGSRIEFIWPIITHQSDLLVDAISLRGYLDRLVDLVSPFPDERWRAPQWIHVEVLEALTVCAEKTEFDLVAFLGDKHARAPGESVEQHLRAHFRGLPVDMALVEEAKVLSDRAMQRFWPRSYKERRTTIDWDGEPSEGEGTPGDEGA